MASAGVTTSAGHAFQPFSRAHTTQPRPRPAAGTAAPAAAPPPAGAARSAAARSRSALPSGSARRAERSGLKRVCPVASGRTSLEQKRAQIHICCYVRIKNSLQEAGDGCCTERSCQRCALPSPLYMRGSACSRDGVTAWSRAAAAPASAAPAAACSWELRRRSESGVGGGGASPGASARRTRSAASHTVSSSPSK